MYFCTFTYDNEKHTEASFRKGLKARLASFAARRGWKYIGVWERSPKTNRLHFHGIFYIPEGTLPGMLLTHKDYSTTAHRMQVRNQSTYFNDEFGRSDFEPIADNRRMGKAMAYRVQMSTAMSGKLSVHEKILLMDKTKKPSIAT